MEYSAGIGEVSLVKKPQKNAWILLCLLIAPLSLVRPEAPEAVAETVAAVDPELLDLSRWEGQVVLLDFWASWCGPCRESFPWMDEMARKYRAQGLAVVAVNLDEDRSAADQFLESTSYAFEFVYDPDGRLAEAFALDVMPTSILFDREGRPVVRHSGFRPADTGEYEQHITELLASQTARGALPLPQTDRKRRKGGVRPWQRGVLAGMQLDGDPIDMAWDDHIYFSKEASSGGRGFGGGGCGCN